MAKKEKQLITSRDRRIISIFGSIIVVLALAWFGIKPALTTHMQLSQTRADLKAQVNQAQSPEEITAMENEIDGNNKTIETILSGFYTPMDSADVDALISQLGNDHNSTVYSLEIGMPSGYTSAPLYQSGTEFSLEAEEEAQQSTNSQLESTEQAAEAEAAGQESETSTSSEESADGSQETEPAYLQGIYAYKAEAIYEGGREDMQGIINDLYDNYPGIKIDAFEWTQVINGNSEESWYLTIDMTVYAYEER